MSYQDRQLERATSDTLRLNGARIRELEQANATLTTQLAEARRERDESCRAITAYVEALAASRTQLADSAKAAEELRAALKETLEAMIELEAKALHHHRYREPLLTALTMRGGIDKILKALRKHPDTAIAAQKES